MKWIFYLITIILLFSSVSAETYFYAGVNSIAMKNDQNNIQFLHKDRMGTEMGVRILPFGQTIESENRFEYTGKETDFSGLHYFGARYYDSNLGRFVSKDPITNNQAYASNYNNPFSAIDPDGREPVELGGSMHGQTIVLGMQNGERKYIKLGVFMTQKIPEQLAKQGISEVEEIVFARVNIRYSDDGDGSFFLYETSFSKDMSQFLAPGATVIMGTRQGINQDEDFNHFVNDLFAHNPGITLNVAPPGFNIPYIDTEGSRLRKFNTADNLYSTTHIGSIEEWDSFMQQEGSMIRIDMNHYDEPGSYGKRRNSPFIYYLPGRIIHEDSMAENDFTPKDRRYLDFMNPEFRQMWIDKGMAKGLTPTNNLDDYSAVKTNNFIQTKLEEN